MATIYRISMTQAQYAAYIAVPTNTVPSNYQIFITDAPAGTPNLYSGDGTNTPAVGTSGGGGGNALLTNWTANTTLNAGQIVLATVAVGGFIVGEHISSNTSRTTGATFNATEAGNFTSVPEDTTVAKKTDFTDGSVQALLDTLRADSVHFLTSASSVDTLTTTGWYNIQNATGGPAGGGWYYYYHGTHRNTATGAPDTNYGFQLAKRLDSGTTNNLLMRVKTSGTWTAWATLATIDVATTTIAGLMSAADKTKLDGVATSAAALSSTTPVMNGTAAVGTGTTAARTDHVHASDTSRAPLDSPTFTGIPTAPTATTGTNTTQLASTAFVKTAVDTAVVGLLDYRGAFTPAVSSGATGYPTTGGSGTSGAILKGDVFVASAAGFILTEAIQAGDSVIAKQDTPGQTATNWDKLNANVSYVPEDQASKVTAFSTPTDTQYPSAKLVNDQLALKADNTDLTDGSIGGYFDSMKTDGVINLASGADLNTLTDNGVFNVNAPLNAPVTGGWWYVEHYRHRNTTIIDGNYAFQRAVRLDSTANTWYHRTRMNAIWGSWEEIVDKTDLTFNGARVTMAADLVMTNGATVSIPWDTETYDTNSYHDNVTNNTRLTAPVAGYYRISGNFVWAANSTGFRALGYRINGGTNVWLSSPLPVTGDFTRHNFSTELYLAAASYIEIMGYQSSGVSLNLGGATSFATMSYLGS